MRVCTMLMTAVVLAATVMGSVRLTAQGTDYMIAVPLNDGSPFAQETEMQIYLSTEADSARVTLRPMQGGAPRTVTVVRGKVTTLTTANGAIAGAWEIPWEQSETVVGQGVRITATQPISVNVLHAKGPSSDGYRAIPTSQWGTRYIVCSYYDFREVFTWSGGFGIVAKEDGTTVDILLRGVTDGTGKTAKGRALNTGQAQRVVLNEGDAYMVYGDGQTRAAFDMTGTEITSNKPIGVYGMHARTALPNSVPLEGRDHLIEMLHPVSAWDTVHVMTEIARTKTRDDGRGDFIRIVAADDDTRWTLKYYDKTTKALVGQDGGTLQAGQFRDLFQAAQRTIFPYGNMVVTSTKPVLVMQYSTSASWDGDTQSDPFMCVVAPTSAFRTSVYTAVPTANRYVSHRINVVAQVRDTTTAVADLSSITINGVSLWNHPNTVGLPLLQNRIPGRADVYIGSIERATSDAPIVIRGNGRVKFGGSVQGNGTFDSYGYPLLAIMPRPSGIDTMAPVVVRGVSDCSSATFEVTELRNIPDPPRARAQEWDQVETGIRDIMLVPDAQNCRLVYVTDPSGVFPRTPSFMRFTCKVEVIDPTREARCTVLVIDQADNPVTEEFVFNAPRLASANPSVDLGDRRLQTIDTVSITINNPSSENVPITLTRMARGAQFDVVAGAAPPIVTLQPGATHTIRVRYRADRETTGVGPDDADLDTLIVDDGCRSIRIPMRARAVVPRISVRDAVLETVPTGMTVCLQSGLVIQNRYEGFSGTDTLVITGIQPLSAPFTLSSPSTPPFPIKIPPSGSVTLRDICANSAVAGTFGTDVVLVTNRAVGDSIGRITVTFGPASSVSEATTEPLPLMVAPNPAKGATSVRWTHPLVVKGELRVTDVLGRVVLRRTIDAGADHADIDVSTLADGNYVVTVDQHGEAWSVTVLVRQ